MEVLLHPIWLSMDFVAAKWPHLSLAKMEMESNPCALCQTWILIWNIVGKLNSIHVGMACNS
jgi:hypothetical protein